MITVTSIAQLRAAVGQARQQGQRIAFVPTMGNLHAGHVALVERASRNAEFVVASIFVNPLQFGAGEDLDKYPRTLVADQEKLSAAGCQVLFHPSVEEMYPNGQQAQTRVSVLGVSEGLCASSRHGHFEGVATVVNKLFNMVQPDIAIFGEKDFQQLAVIRTMVRDLNMPIEIIGQPTIRAEDGLALSSRNGYLSPEQRALAPVLYRTLKQIGQVLVDGSNHFAQLEAQAKTALSDAGLRPDYVEIREALSLRPAQAGDQQLVVLAAAYLGNTRLIDNLSLTR